MQAKENNDFIKGKQLAEKHRYSDSIVSFTMALEKEENPNIYYERALAFFHCRDIDSSLADLDKAQELEPENPYRYASRAYIRDKAGDPEGAMEDYKKAIELDPSDAISYNNLGLLEEKAGFAEMAKQHFNKADTLSGIEHFRNDTGIPGTTQNNSQIQFAEKAVSKNNILLFWREIRRVFSSRKAFSEFYGFVKNGGKF